MTEKNPNYRSSINTVMNQPWLQASPSVYSNHLNPGTQSSFQQTIGSNHSNPQNINIQPLPSLEDMNNSEYNTNIRSMMKRDSTISKLSNLSSISNLSQLPPGGTVRRNSNFNPEAMAHFQKQQQKARNLTPTPITNSITHVNNQKQQYFIGTQNNYNLQINLQATDVFDDPDNCRVMESMIDYKKQTLEEMVKKVTFTVKTLSMVKSKF